jgi:glycosyltransferase involved in cell wall biosynthesis
MKILVASIQLPWPLDSGGKVALYTSFACLRNDHRFILVCPVWDEQGLNDAIEFQAHFPEMKVRVAYCGPPKAPQAQDDLLLRSFRRAARTYRRWKSTPNPPAVIDNQPKMPSYPFGLLPTAFVDAVADELSQGVDLFQAEFAEMLSLGTWVPSDIPKVFIHHQLHFVYANRLAAARMLHGYSEYLEKVIRIQEETYLRTFDGVVVFSQEDKRALSEWLEDERVHVSPFPIISGSKTADEEFKGRFSFVGSEAHFPNKDGLEWLLGEVWDSIASQMPDATLQVIGQWGEASRARFSRPGVEFTGYVEDLGHAIGGSVVLVPLRIGSGIRVKLLDAMSYGVPAVSTSIGCEGIPVRDGVHILIRDAASEYAAAAIALAKDPLLRRRLASAGRDLVTELYSPERVRIRRNEIYETVCRQARGTKISKQGAARP